MLGLNMNEHVTVTKTRRDLIILTYAMFTALGALLLFLYGFFPIKYDHNNVATFGDIPDHVEHVRIKTDQLYKPLVKKVVLLVIDALRWDFITGPIGAAAMPITYRLMNTNQSVCLMQAKAHPPTVTMPRIKSMMTGAVPNFIDVALNFGDLPVSGDSFIVQAKSHGHKMHFYGDDTWIKIFPNMFTRYEGTTSFFVSDFKEVDDNVTRHINNELKKNEDWSVLILHYLGLDHIGHVAGPFSPLIKPKLTEMDNIIGEIHKSVQKWNENGLPAMLAICGDHGMKDSGGHGGSTPEETLVPFLTFGLGCPSKPNEPNRMSQVDIAATLSVMLGIPIPSSNIGSIPLNMLSGLTDSSKLFILYYNARQVFKHFENYPNYATSDAYKHYKNAIDQHVNWLIEKKDSADIEPVVSRYNKALNLMKETLIHSMIEYDLHAMTIAMILMIHVIYITANGHTYSAGAIKKTAYCIVGYILLYLLLRLAWEPERLVSIDINCNRILLTTIAMGFFVLNSNLCANLSWPSNIKTRVLNANLQQTLFVAGMIAHIISLASSSFVEEEHQTWYFFWATFLICLLYSGVRKRCNLQQSVKILLVMLGHRVLRKLNSTGNKYAQLPDIANWLRDQENNGTMTVLLGVAITLLIWIGYRSEEKRYRNKTLIMHVGAGICIYLRHMANGAVAKFYTSSSKGLTEVRIFWIIVFIYTFYWIHRLYRIPERKIFVQTLLRFIVQLWVTISALLHRTHNVILLPMQLLCSSVIRDSLIVNEAQESVLLYAHIWMGNVFYFYQGNSNSLATIDVAAGYIGLDSYRPILTGLFMAINTYSAPVLAYLTLISHSANNSEPYSYPTKILSVHRNYALWRFLPVAVYTIVVTIERFHLFVWTVFSPKLLYEAMHCAVLFTFMLLLQFLAILFYRSLEFPKNS